MNPKGQRLICDGTKLLQKLLFYLFWDNWYPVLMLLKDGGFLCKVLGVHAVVLLSCVSGVTAPETPP